MVERILSKEMYILTWAAGKILGSKIAVLSRKKSVKSRIVIGQRNDINTIIIRCFRMVKSKPRIYPNLGYIWELKIILIKTMKSRL